MIITEGLEWKQIYWLRGAAPKNVRYRNGVLDPPCSGWQRAFVLVGEKMSTLFCPYSLKAYTIKNTCSEIELAKEPADFNQKGMLDLMVRMWREYQGFGFQRDYDTCALILRKLGRDVPAQIMTGGGEDDRKKGGKEVAAYLLKPVKEVSKRGKFLKWFLDGDCSRSVREAMAEFAMTRSNALSYLHMIHKDHGIGYVLVGDIATVVLPPGCIDPFNEKQPATSKTKDKDDDSWLD